MLLGNINLEKDNINLGKEVKSDEFSEIGIFFIWPPPKPFGPLQTPFLDPPMSFLIELLAPIYPGNAGEIQLFSARSFQLKKSETQHAKYIYIVYFIHNRHDGVVFYSNRQGSAVLHSKQA